MPIIRLWLETMPKWELNDSTTEFKACLNANGLYNSVQCVLPSPTKPSALSIRRT